MARTRDGGFSSKLLPYRKSYMPGFDRLVWALFYAGISTRKTGKVLEAFYGMNRLCQEFAVKSPISHHKPLSSISRYLLPVNHSSFRSIGIAIANLINELSFGEYSENRVNSCKEVVYEDDTLLDSSERLYEKHLELLAPAIEAAYEGNVVDARTLHNRKMPAELEREFCVS